MQNPIKKKLARLDSQANFEEIEQLVNIEKVSKCLGSESQKFVKRRAC